MTIRTRLPRHHRSPFKRLPLPTWFMILVGIAGLFLPILQGGLMLALGLALLSIGSQTMHLWFRSLMGRWPRIWKRLEKFRRKIHFRLHKASGSPKRDAVGEADSAPPE